MRSSGRARGTRRLSSQPGRWRRRSCGRSRWRSRALRSVDLETGGAAEALVERSDVSAVEALAVVAEAAVAFELARAAREKFGGDALGDFVGAWQAYLERIGWTRR